VPRVARGTQSQRLTHRSFKICSFEDPRAILNWVERIDLASLSGEPQSSWGDTDERRRVTKVKPRLSTIVGTPMDRNPVLRAERSHRLPDPSIPVPCLNAVAIEKTGYDIVLGDKCELADRLNDVGRRAVALSATAQRQTMFGVHPTHPVDGHDDLAGRIVDIGDGLLDHRPRNALLQASVSRGRRPDRFKVLGQCGEADRFDVDPARRRRDRQCAFQPPRHVLTRAPNALPVHE